MALVTYEAVVAAAESLIADGQKASVRNVMKKIGGGSPNTVLQLLGEWKAGRPVIRSSDIELDPSITAAIVRQMQKIAGDAAVAAEERTSAMSDDLQTMAESNQSLEQENARLTAELAMVREDVDRQIALQHDNELRYQSEIDTLKAKVSEISNDLDKERDRANASQQALGKAEARAEAVPALEATIAKLQADLAVERTARAAAEQRAAVSETQGRLVAEQASKTAADAAKAADKSDQAHADALAQLRKDIDDARQAASRQVEQLKAEANKAAGEHKEQLAQARRDIDEAKAEAREAVAELKATRAQIDALHEAKKRSNRKDA